MGILISLILATIRQAAPILITAIGGMFAEVTGVVKIGVEGMMLMGAFTKSFGNNTCRNVCRWIYGTYPCCIEY